MSKKSLIDSIEVKTPCSADWNEMKGSERIRFCEHCRAEVNNISLLTRKQAQRLVRRSNGRICVRYVKNPVTSRPVFADKLYRITRRAGLAAGVLGASLTLSSLTYAQGSPVAFKKDRQTQASTDRQSVEERSEATAQRILGTVTDQNGAVIPNVLVTLIDMKTAASRLVSSDDNGLYLFENVAPGVYHLRFENVAGFTPKEVTDLKMTEGRDIKYDVTLNASEGVEVSVGGAMFVEYQSSLAQAVSADDIEEVANLIARGANVNHKDEVYDDITPLFIAVENGSLEIAQMLLDYGAKVNQRNASRQTPLMRLDEDASPALVRLLIKHGAKIDLADTEGNTALISAARFAKAEVLQTLLDHGAGVNARNKQGQTALLNAAEADNLESVRALIMAGADVNQKNNDGESAWDLTSSGEIEQLLEMHGAKTEIIDN